MKLKHAIYSLLATLCVGLQFSTAAVGQQLPQVKVGRLMFPSMFTIITDVVTEQKLDRKNGFDLVPVNHGTIAADYAAYTTGETDMGSGGFLVLQKMRSEKVPITAVFTVVPLTDMVIISEDPHVRSISDLKGKTLAADMGSSQYYVLSTYARSIGIELGKDITVIQANPALAREELRAKRVDAAMTWEPTTTLALGDSKEYRIILHEGAAWKQLAKHPGWELLVLMREQYVQKNPNIVPKIMKAFQEGAQFIKSDPEAADAIAAKNLKLPPGALKDAITSDRLQYVVRPAYKEKAALDEMFQIAIKTGYMPSTPTNGAIYSFPAESK
jgi:NitT/TauT family transport system substrate-binding protein